MYKKKLYHILKTNHVKPGKGGAFMQLEMKGVKCSTKLNERLRSDENVEKPLMTEEHAKYLHTKEKVVSLHCADLDEDIEVDISLFGEQHDLLPLLNEKDEITLTECEDEFIRASIPDQIEVEIMDTEVYIKGQTATSSYKPAKLKNKKKIMIPPFVSTGEHVIIKTQDLTYVERIKK